MSRTDCQAPEGAILIVTGSDLRAEQMDRPLAYYLQQCITKELGPIGHPIFVVSDCRYLYQSGFDECATISVGGPGVNAVAHSWLRTVPFVFAADDEFYVQMNDAIEEPARASIWGVDHETTKLAIATFVERFLDEFLLNCHARVHGST